VRQQLVNAYDRYTYIYSRGCWVEEVWEWEELGWVEEGWVEEGWVA
jgi:hypothetical protein